jgi:hypothetical protein
MQQLETTSLEYAFGSEPLPTVARTTETRDRMYALLQELAVNMSLDVNRSKRATQAHVYRFRRQFSPDAQYRIRALKPGWSRIWRVK